MKRAALLAAILALALPAAARANYGDAYVTECCYGQVLEAGQVADEYFVMTNTGTVTWGTEMRLATDNPRDRVSAFADPSWLGPTRVTQVSGTVPPGQNYTFAFKVRAPAAPGS